MTGNDIQMCFLLCSLFPEDDEILIELLIMCGIGLGLFPYANSIEDKRNEIGVALKKLQKSGWLLETDGADSIRMHDVVRDFAHWLTSTGENRFMGDGLLVVSSTFFEEMKALQVAYLKFVRFSLKGFHSLPNLKTLCCEFCELENFSSSLTNMRNLEILALVGTEIDEISEELVKLSTLKYLRFFLS
ncbi:hypothetical protein J1N35_028245 [Gossypium stocksii]|uniref:Uncharacterized protein n=1 Tax=Gossypium stocksii TaxID=47602 RepID=A0A9D3UVT5_9ROSI|nr:hypothetical protein J1N35_028245 [Gossypium stocksii]